MDTYKVEWTIVEQKVFSLLCLRTGEKMSQREIAKELDVSPTAVANAVTKLERSSLVKRERNKTINFISLNRESENAATLKRVENLKSLYVSGLSAFLEESLPGTTIILFGSYARGEDTITSDIDIAVIGRKEKMVVFEPYEETLRRTINIHFYASWDEIHAQLKNNILNGIVLHGSVDL